MSNRCHHCGQVILPEKLQDKIVNTVAGYFKTDLKHLQIRTRERKRSYPRQVLMYFLRYQTTNNLKSIADIFKMDHSTVVHACQKIHDLMDVDFMVRQDIANIETLLNFNQEC